MITSLQFRDYDLSFQAKGDTCEWVFSLLHADADAWSLGSCAAHEMPPPMVGDLDGDGDSEVVLLHPSATVILGVASVDESVAIDRSPFGIATRDAVARQVLDLALARTERRREVARRAIGALTAAGRFDLAERVLRSAFSDHEDPTGIRLLGDVALLSGRHGDAKRAYERCGESLPDGIVDEDAVTLASKLSSSSGRSELLIPRQWSQILPKDGIGLLSLKDDISGMMGGRNENGLQRELVELQLTTPAGRGMGGQVYRLRSADPLWNGEDRMRIRFSMNVLEMPYATGFELRLTGDADSPPEPIRLGFVHQRNGLRLEGDRYTVRSPLASIGVPNIEFELGHWLEVDIDFVPELNRVHVVIDFENRAVHDARVGELHFTLPKNRLPSGYWMELACHQYFEAANDMPVTTTVWLDKLRIER